MLALKVLRGRMLLRSEVAQSVATGDTETKAHVPEMHRQDRKSEPLPLAPFSLLGLVYSLTVDTTLEVLRASQLWKWPAGTN